MRRWRLPLVLSGLVLLAQLLHRSPLVVVDEGRSPADVSLAWPILHVVLTPFTLIADWLNGGGTGDLIGFAAWSLLLYFLWRLFAEPPRRAGRELAGAALFLLGFGAFIWWGARWSRPIPRLVAADSTLIVFDTHSHTSASHDGRPEFGAAANARWHLLAGFDAAFVTDHNVFGAARRWQVDRAGRPPRLLDGEELSLSGLHMVVLGNDAAIANKPWDASFDSSLALLRTWRGPPVGRDSTAAFHPFLVASLPEYWRHHWGPDLGRIVTAGTEGIEIWTTSPRAMDFPPHRRREVIARGRSLGLALLGATDMHGLGYSASVWNVLPLPGWRALSDSALTRALIEALRARPGDVRVIAMQRRLAPTRGAQMAGAPLGIFEVLRSASRAHAVALLLWIWAPALLLRGRRHEGPGGPGPSPPERAGG